MTLPRRNWSAEELTAVAREMGIPHDGEEIGRMPPGDKMLEQDVADNDRIDDDDDGDYRPDTGLDADDVPIWQMNRHGEDWR